MDKAKKIIKIVAIIIAVAAAVVGIAFAVKKIIDKKKPDRGASAASERAKSA